MRLRSLIAPVIAVIVVGAIALALGSSRAGSTHPASPVLASGKAVHLTISNYAFQPPALTVKVGTVVTVKNTDATAHTASARNGAFDSGTVNQGQAVRFTLRKPGTFSYYCKFHAFMTGTIKVVP